MIICMFATVGYLLDTCYSYSNYVFHWILEGSDLGPDL